MPSAREMESKLIARCAEVALGSGRAAQDPCEANVFALAAHVVHSRYAGERENLMRASERYFAAHPDDRLGFSSVLEKGWILGLPRLRDFLDREIEERRQVA